MQRKSTKQSRGASPQEREFIVWMKERNCSYCGNPGPSRYDHCAGSSAKIKVDFETVIIGHYFGLAECMACAELSHKDKYLAFGPHHKLWALEIDSYSGVIPDLVKAGVALYGTKYGR